MPQAECRFLKALALRDRYARTDPFIPADASPVRSRTVECALSRVVLDPCSRFSWNYHNYKVYRKQTPLPIIYPFSFYGPANAATLYRSCTGALHLHAHMGLGEYDVAVH